MFTKAFIPFRGYYASPFSKWQMTLANEHSLDLAGRTVSRWLAAKDFDPKQFDYAHLGFTIHQRWAFWGAAWVAAMIGAEQAPGCSIVQACSTSTTCLYYSAAGIELGTFSNAINVVADRLSNGPHAVWPNPSGPGGEVIHENWVMDNFERDPHAGVPPIQTAENTAKEAGITKDECDEAAACRYEQYAEALKDDRAFQKRYMFPVEVKLGKKRSILLEEDEGITPTSLETLRSLGPVVPGGVHSYGSQTHPADGNASIIVTTRDRAAALSEDPNVAVQIVSYGQARAEKAMMSKAPVPAAEMALTKAGLRIADMKAIKTHNPFITNDVYFAKKFALDPSTFNNYGSPMVFGHPQAATGARCVIELIEELVEKGGGFGLFTGCAAGDCAAALVLKVGA